MFGNLQYFVEMKNFVMFPNSNPPFEEMNNTQLRWPSSLFSVLGKRAAVDAARGGDKALMLHIATTVREVKAFMRNQIFVWKAKYSTGKTPSKAAPKKTREEEDEEAFGMVLHDKAASSSSDVEESEASDGEAEEDASAHEVDEDVDEVSQLESEGEGGAGSQDSQDAWEAQMRSLPQFSVKNLTKLYKEGGKAWRPS